MYRFSVLLTLASLTPATFADQQLNRMTGINVLFDQPLSEALLAELEVYGRVLDVIPEINTVTLRAPASALAEIQALEFVAAASADSRCHAADPPDVPDFADGTSLWNLDAINVTDFGAQRTIGYDGSGVYVAVIDTGLPHNWREYFPQERIAAQFARGFGGGGGERGTVSEQPDKWERDTSGHGTGSASVILGFNYFGTYFNGVAPNATIIPVRVFNNQDWGWHSRLTRAIVYLANLKVDGALGSAPLVINFSGGSFDEDAAVRAAIDYAIANGVIFVAAAGNEADVGMRFPARYSPVISVAALGWVDQFPADDPTTFEWMLRDVPESDPLKYFVATYSSRVLAGQDLDLAAPAHDVPSAWTLNGRVDHTFIGGTSAACPHVSGVAALMLQKNPTLTQSQIEAILEGSASPLPPGCRDIVDAALHNGRGATWSDHDTVFFFETTVCWDADATGAGLLQADAALAATPLP